ncbi:hypothetical protein, partial [Burkholderia sp. SIMBA_019]|uniref:hypothetical protein n=1 Tax=Burkholderia sp. SIMBA_019 TaxID=3085765 RepID=UPI00397CC387
MPDSDWGFMPTSSNDAAACRSIHSRRWAVGGGRRIMPKVVRARHGQLSIAGNTAACSRNACLTIHRARDAPTRQAS